MNITEENILNLFDGSKYPIYMIDDSYHILFNNEFIEKKFPNIVGDKCFYALYGRSKPCDACVYYETIKNNDITVKILDKEENLLEIDKNYVKSIGLPMITDTFTKCIIIEFDDTKECLKYEGKLNALEALTNKVEQNNQIQKEKDIYYTNQAHEISRFIQNINYRIECLARAYPKIER